MKPKHLILVFIILVCKKSIAQYSPIKDTDTLNALYSKVLDFVSNGVDTLNIHVFERIKKDKKRVIHFATFDTSYLPSIFPTILQNPSFRQILNLDCKDCVVINLGIRNSYTSFISVDSTKANKMKCRLEIYPPVRSNKIIGLEVLVRSPGYDDEMFGSYLYFVFTPDLRLIYFRKTEITY